MSQELMTPQQVADFLQIPVRGVYERASRRTLPCVKLREGRMLRFRREDIEKELIDFPALGKRHSRSRS